MTHKITITSSNGSAWANCSCGWRATSYWRYIVDSKVEQHKRDQIGKKCSFCRGSGFFPMDSDQPCAACTKAGAR